MENILIKRFAELSQLEPNINNWSTLNFKGNPPRLIRLKMIDSLLKALQLNCNYSELIKGNFINHIEIDYHKLIELIGTEIPEISSIIDFEENSLAFGLPYMFEGLLRYRLTFQSLKDVNAGVLMCRGMHLAQVVLTNKITKDLEPHIELVDKIIGYLLNPRDINFPEKDLIDKYNFPDDDLLEIDIMWM
ncbi:hypothetical protein FRY74_06220 [Vicingus serpentipes]|uniref:Uncharacterized protein n=1 Tax=Vicingus serpentipes TaxID=1926625 RepID=A0A5C6RW41_9FLAO|nr:hypothetical protein [Vicingus serpentipes]TXB66165.1 hypothetical protein FRY74_06220 [Vicingus serpentipes]